METTNTRHPYLWVGASTAAPTVNKEFDVTTPSLARSLIGTERNLIVYNAFERFDVDAFAAICGTLMHGGTLFLLTPQIATWPAADSLEMQRFTVFGQSHKRQSHYLRWLITRLHEHTHSVSKNDEKQTPGILAQTASVRKLNPRQISDPAIIEAMRDLETRHQINERDADTTAATPSQPNPEQQQILQQWCKQPIATAERTQLRILTADRGRGKSALLGMLCAELLLQNHCCVVTGPNRRSSEILMRHCKERLIDDQHTRALPDFKPPDELLTNPVNADVLLVDEAAALPLPVLKKLVETYQHVILATTVHGYEGAGRGFSIRFRDWLQNNRIAFSWKTLESPVRWLQGDHLEIFCNDAFILDAEYAPVNHQSIVAKECSVDFYPAEKLLSEPDTLRQCFALLVQAHYQTKPMDLRHMLDGQNICVYVLSHKSAILGTALVAIETLGESADSELKCAIVEKRRRPIGHLLPQLLAQWTQDEAALHLCIARIVRIAIIPEYQNRGLGSHFLICLEKQLPQQLPDATPIDAIGAVFGEDERVTRFWQHNHYHKFHLGRRKNNRSGTRSLAVIKSIGQPLSIIDRARYLYSINFSTTLSPEDFETDTLSKATRRQLNSEMTNAYLKANRSFEDSRQFVIAVIKDRLDGTENNQAGLTKKETSLLTHAIQADFEFTYSAMQLGYSGKKSAEIAFKTALEKLIR